MAFLVCHGERRLQRNAKHEARLSNSLAVTFTDVDKINPEIESLASWTSSAALQLRFAQNDNAGFVLTLQPFNSSTHHTSAPFVHLFRERTPCAVGIVLHTEIFVDLQQTLLMRDGAQKLFPARIISKETCRSGLEAAI